MSTKNFVSNGDAETLFTGIGNKLSSLKSGLTNLDNEVNGDATVYPYADVITISDAVPANLADCTVKIEPVQDLHGQSAPYVGGAGKNKLPLVLADIKAANTDGSWSGNVYTLRGITYTILTDDSGNVVGININGSTQGYNNGSVFGINSSFELTPQSYILSDNVANKPSQSYGLYFNLIKTGQSGHVAEFSTYNSASTTANTTNFDYDTAELGFYMFGNKTIDNVTFYPMIRLSTETDATFAPYTNYCPITGHTNASVQRDGKNLLSGIENNSWSSSDQIKIANDKRARSTDLIAVEPSTQYTISATALSGKTLNAVAQIYSGYGENKLISETGWQALPHTFQTPNNAVCIDIIFKTTDDATNTADYIANAQLELGSTATPYVPYADKTYTIALGDTIYGGTVDFKTGVMTVTHGFLDVTDFTYSGSSSSGGGLKWANATVDLKGTSVKSSMLEYKTSNASWNSTTPCINSNSTERRIRVYVTETTESDFLTAYADLQVVYELTTPTTIQLTPQQIQLLQGQNTLTASTGQISVTVNGVSGAIGSVQTQANATDAALSELAADIAEKLPTAPTTDGAYVLTVTVADGMPTYSWESAT